MARSPFPQLRDLGLSPLFFAAPLGWVIVLCVGLFSNAFSPLRVEQLLQAKAEQALREGGFAFASVDMDGQIARLSGYATSEEEVRAARIAVLRSAGLGGPWLGGVTAVRPQEFRALTPAVSPYVWRAERDGGTLRISGVAPSIKARERLAARAQSLFPDMRIEEQATPAAGVPPGPPWVEMAELALEQLARLNAGDVRLVDARVIVSGDATSANADAIRAAMRALPAPYVADVDVLAPGQELGGAGLAGVTLARPDPATCQSAFDRLQDDAKILFEPDSAALDPSGVSILDTLVRIARRCDRYTIDIAGHTSAEGEQNLNLSLSRDRAQAVVDYLVQRGVPRERLTAEGFGASRPVASNLTPAGRAANRRIEFTVRR